MGHPITPTQSEKQPLLPTTNYDKQTSPESVPLEENQDDVRGYLYMASATVGFGTMMLLVRAAETRYAFPPMSTLFIRGFIQMTFALIMIATTVGFRTAFEPIDLRTLKLLCLRGLAGTCALITTYEALKRLPVGETQTIASSSPVFTMIMSYFVLGETITRIEMGAALTSIMGVALVVRPYASHDLIPPQTRIAGSIFSILAAVSASIAYVFIRNLASTLHMSVIVLAFGVVSFVVSICCGGVVTIEYIQSNTTGFLLAFCGALLAFVGQCLVTKGLRYCKAGPGVLMRSIDIPILYLLGLIFLQEVPSLMRLLGSSLVIAAVITIGLARLLRA